MPIKHFDMFSGYGGFTLGVKRIFPDVETIGFSEIDPYAIGLLKYRFPNIKNYGDATRIVPREIPDFDLLTFGYPCQDNSISGKRLGQKDGKRSSLLSYAIEILRVKKPKYFVAENVTGLLSVNEGSDFYKTIRDFYEVGYDVTWQCLNTRQLLPQNRDRIFIVGSLRDGSRQKILFVSEDEVISFKENKTGERRTQTKDSETGVTLRTKQGRADDTYIVKTLQTKNTRREINIVGYSGSGDDRKVGNVNSRQFIHGTDGIMSSLSQTDYKQAKQILVVGHSGSGGQKGDIHDPSGIMSNLNASDYKQPKQIVVESKKVKEISPKGKRYSSERIYDIEGSAVTLKSGGGGLGAKTGLYAVPSKVKKAMTQSGGDSRVGKERSYHESKVAGALTKPSGTAATFLFEDHDVRRLTPVECERLQGLENGWTEYGMFKTKQGDMEKKKISDTQRYALVGNGVTVDVIELLFWKLKQVYKLK
jgi:DNA (cytosine-5)-methyltransferase 1